MKEKLKKISEFRWRLPASAKKGMRVAAEIVASKAILDAAEDQAVEQLTNVACLPGAIEPVLAMPDFHWGYQP